MIVMVLYDGNEGENTCKGRYRYSTCFHILKGVLRGCVIIEWVEMFFVEKVEMITYMDCF